MEVIKAAISNTNEIKKKATIAEFPTRAGRTKKNNDNKIIINEKVAVIFFVIIK